MNTILKNKSISKTPEPEKRLNKNSPPKSISNFEPSMEDQKALAQSLLNNSKSFKELLQKIQDTN